MIMQKLSVWTFQDSSYSDSSYSTRDFNANSNINRLYTEMFIDRSFILHTAWNIQNLSLKSIFQENRYLTSVAVNFLSIIDDEWEALDYGSIFSMFIFVRVKNDGWFCVYIHKWNLLKNCSKVLGTMTIKVNFCISLLLQNWKT